MRAARLLTVIAAVLALGSCQVLEVIFGSVFPSTVGLAKAQADLSSKISLNDAGSFNLRAVQSGSNGYVIVIGNPGNTGTVAYVYDLDLSPKTTLSVANGQGVLVDGAGNVVIGDTAYNAATLASLGAILPPNSLSGYTEGGLDGLTGAASAQVVNFGFNQGSTTLNFTNTTSAAVPPWSAFSSTSVTFTGGPSSLQLDAVLDDGNPSGNGILAVSQPSSGGSGNTATCYFITAAKSAFPAGGVSPTLLGSAPHLDNIVVNCIGYAQGSLIVYDGKAGRFLQVDPATGSVRKSLYSGSDMSNTRLSYLEAGGWFYGFDTKTRVVTKYAAWW